MTVEPVMSSAERAVVMRILDEIVPEREVRAFGSRVTRKAKPYSDLDLAIMGDEPLPMATRARLEEAFTDSILPWKVDVLDWASTDEGFRGIVGRECVVLKEKNSKP